MEEKNHGDHDAAPRREQEHAVRDAEHGDELAGPRDTENKRSALTNREREVRWPIG